MRRTSCYSLILIILKTKVPILIGNKDQCLLFVFNAILKYSAFWIIYITVDGNKVIEV